MMKNEKSLSRLDGQNAPAPGNLAPMPFDGGHRPYHDHGHLSTEVPRIAFLEHDGPRPLDVGFGVEAVDDALFGSELFSENLHFLLCLLQ